MKSKKIIVNELNQAILRSVSYIEWDWIPPIQQSEWPSVQILLDSKEESYLIKIDTPEDIKILSSILRKENIRFGIPWFNSIGNMTNFSKKELCHILIDKDDYYMLSLPIEYKLSYISKMAQLYLRVPFKTYEGYLGHTSLTAAMRAFFNFARLPETMPIETFIDSCILKNPEDIVNYVFSVYERMLSYLKYDTSAIKISSYLNELCASSYYSVSNEDNTEILEKLKEQAKLYLTVIFMFGSNETLKSSQLNVVSNYVDSIFSLSSKFIPFESWEDLQDSINEFIDFNIDYAQHPQMPYPIAYQNFMSRIRDKQENLIDNYNEDWKRMRSVEK